MEDTLNNGLNQYQFMDDDQEDNETTHEFSGSETPPNSSIFINDSKLTSTSSPKKSSKRGGIQKRVVSVPIKDVESLRLKGEISNNINTPPSDSWAWRKYGQKPIKGSPYPRGYYKCSSSKGCPARKQVERSSVDPTMLVITYSSEHNHPGPASRNNNSAAVATKPRKPEIVQPEPEPEPHEPEEKFADLGGDDEFSWFTDMDTTSSTVLESPIFSERSNALGDAASDLAMFFPMREEDESLFADLGELPECSIVFRQGIDIGPPAKIFKHVSSTHQSEACCFTQTA